MLSPCVKPQSRGEEIRTEDEADQEIAVSLDARHQTQVPTGSWEQPVVPQDKEIALEKLSVSSVLLSGCIFVIMCDFVPSGWNCRFFEKKAERASRTVGVQMFLQVYKISFNMFHNC